MTEQREKAVGEPPLDCNVGPKIDRYLRQLAPHQKEREGPTLLRSALAAIDGLARYAQHQQARIDALMLEYCPDEMTPEQIAEWERHQRAVPNCAELNGARRASDLSAELGAGG